MRGARNRPSNCLRSAKNSLFRPFLRPPTLVSETSRSITVEWNQYTDGGVAIAYKVYCKGHVQTDGRANGQTDE